MPDYQKMYHSLFNDVTEEMYMDSKETVLTPFLKKSEEQDKKPSPTKKKPPSHDER